MIVLPDAVPTLFLLSVNLSRCQLHPVSRRQTTQISTGGPAAGTRGPTLYRISTSAGAARPPSCHGSLGTMTFT